ncbi:MAG: DegT/DnrJ/EryC1/StrS family aminotransferase [Kiritimatiellia bacterium]|jgi:dTDP-4-amino-4,6-dideoxygalactose transaminase
MKRFETPTYVTRPYLPPLDEFKQGLEEIWENQWLTNNGPVLKRFHASLADYLGVPETNLSLLTNGTLALEIVFQAMGLAGGEVITTPFTFVATAHAIKRIGAEPVFADIDPQTLCLDPVAAEKMITPRTKAIVPVHVYGHPCDVDAFDRLGREYGVKIIYDAAHAFGVKVDGKSIACHGDASMFSFHSTKLFHSIEGGLLVFKDPNLQQQVDRLKNFAILSETECVDVGTNAKMNEFQALMGEQCLKVIDELIAHRKAVCEVYRCAFANTSVQFIDRLDPIYGKAVVHNYAYCPVLFGSFNVRETVYRRLKDFNVFSRRYFYPLLTDFAPYVCGKDVCHVAKEMAARVLTLPTYHGLDLDDVKAITDNVKEIVG